MARQNQSANVPLHPSYIGMVHTTMDAVNLFEACLSGRLQHCPRRPHDRERASLIRSGHIFIYEEDASGIKRWTDGVSWSPSRIMGNYLIYRELDKPFPPGEKKRAAKRARKADEGGDQAAEDAESPTTKNGSEVKKAESAPIDDALRAAIGSLVESYPFKAGGLVKKTISIKYRGVPHHLVSYYNVEDAISGNLIRPAHDSELTKYVPRGELIFEQNFRSSLEEVELDAPLHTAPLMSAYQAWNGAARSMSVPSTAMSMAQPAMPHWPGPAGMVPPHQMPQPNPYQAAGYPHPSTRMSSVAGLPSVSAPGFPLDDDHQMRTLGAHSMSSNPDPTRRHSTAYDMNAAQGHHHSTAPQYTTQNPHYATPMHNPTQGPPFSIPVQSTAQDPYTPSVHDSSRAHSSMGNPGVMQDDFTFENPSTSMEGSSTRQQDSFPSPRTAPRAHALVGMGTGSFDGIDESGEGEWGSMIGLNNPVHGQSNLMATQGATQAEGTTSPNEAPARHDLAGGFGPNSTWSHGFPTQ